MDTSSQEKSARTLAQSLVNYHQLNNPSAHGPKEWWCQVPAIEESGYIFVDYAMIGAFLEGNPILLEEAKDRSDWKQ